MRSLVYHGKKMQHLCSGSWQSTRSFVSSCYLIICCYYRGLLLWLNPLSIYIIYFVSLSLAGFGILTSLNPRTTTEFKPSDLDLFFTSVSAATVSSMSTVEMETFSNAQLVAVTVLMFVGGEVFTSMLGLHFKRSKIIRTWKSEAKVESLDIDLSTPPSPGPAPPSNNFDDDFREMSIVVVSESGVPRYESHKDIFSTAFNPFIKYDSVKFLGFLVLGYLLVIQILGVLSVLLYLSLVSSARHALENKGIKTITFAVFTVVSTFANCGFVPTNENMMVFSKNSGLLLILIPQILLGNTLFPSGLRFLIWVVGRRFKKDESQYLLRNNREVGYLHLLPGVHSLFLVGSVVGLTLIGFVLFCAMEWNSAILGGLNGYQKVVGIVFQCVNARHTGETVVDLSAVAPAMLVFFVAMMYLPPYTSFLPASVGGDGESEGKKKRRRSSSSSTNKENLIFSQLTYLVIFVMIICITERKSMKDEPLNFSLFNIVVEVTSAYGNVGFTTGYSCDRLLRHDADCTNKWYGFSGKWSDEGKIVLILVMLFGRLKKFSMNGGKAWKLL